MTLVETWRNPFVHVRTTMLVPGYLIVTKPSTGRRIATVKMQLFVLPHASRAVAVTVFVVFGRNAVPEGGTEVTVTLLHVSVAKMDQNTMALVLQVKTTMLVGQVIVGGVVSTTVTVCEQVELLLQQSVACQVRVMIC
jgi:hypothetical protein